MQQPEEAMDVEDIRDKPRNTETQCKREQPDKEPPQPTEWKCLNCNYMNHCDIFQAVFSDSDEGRQKCVICAFVTHHVMM